MSLQIMQRANGIKSLEAILLFLLQHFLSLACFASEQVLQEKEVNSKRDSQKRAKSRENAKERARDSKSEKEKARDSDKVCV